MNSGTSDDTLSENGSSTLTSDYVSAPDDLPPSMAPLSTAKPPPPLPTLFESRPPASSGYISSEQFDPFSVDSPDSDSLPTPKFSTQDAASESGYFPMPSTLDVQPTQHKQNGSFRISPSSSSNKISASLTPDKADKVGRSELLSSDYVAAPSDLSQTSPSSTSSAANNARSALASTSAAVAKKSRQLFAKVLPKKSSSASSLSKGSKTKSDPSLAQQPTKQTPQQPPAPPTSSSSTGDNEVDENDDSDMGDLVDLLDLGDPVDQGTGPSSSYSAANGSQSLAPTSDVQTGHSSGYFEDSSFTMGAPPSSTLGSTLTADPFSSKAQSTVSSINSGYFQPPESIGLSNVAPATTTTATPYQPFSEDDDPDAFFLPDLPGDSDMNSSAGGGVNYGGSIVTLSGGGGQFTTFDNTKK